ncbi:putative dehydrogenase [Labrys monachus]|uniref:Dehydrogenase n=1 Tax=Labrys monachus TaxID=217067 RepID=A0ABU0FC24_9HYPH|nr:putative dehydrogenase [Labrys monachus]
MSTVRIMLLGTGNMAANHAHLIRMTPDAEVVAGVDVDARRARNFSDEHGIPYAFGDLDEAIAWGKFDAVANVTPDQAHHPTTMKLLAAGKHVLCEKPLAETFPLADEMARAAEKAGLVNMVNLSYRDVPALQTAQIMIARGEIGEVRHIEASYRQSWLVGNHWGDWRTEPRWLWRLSEKHGSKGVLGDIGIHILDFASYAVGMTPVAVQAQLATFSKAPGNQIGEYSIDANDSAVMSVRFENGALGVIHASRFMTGYANTLKLAVFGTTGAIELSHGQYTSLRICSGDGVHNQAWRDLATEPVKTNYQRFVAAIESGKTAEPSFRHAANLQRVIDRCYDMDAAAAPQIA